jgi:hypothetical protein
LSEGRSLLLDYVGVRHYLSRELVNGLAKVGYLLLEGFVSPGHEGVHLAQRVVGRQNLSSTCDGTQGRC